MADNNKSGLLAKSPETQSELVRFFGRHIISLIWIDRTPGVRAVDNQGYGHSVRTSAFVVSVRDVWFLVTAGHILRDIVNARQGGQTIEEFTIDDTWGTTTSNTPLPFDFDGAQKHHICNDEGMDYAAIHLRQNYRDLLFAGNTKPFDEIAWKNLPSGIESLAVAGFPAEFGTSLRNADQLVMSDTCILLPMGAIDEPPELRVRYKRLYGGVPATLRSSDTGTLESLDGLSGGPVIGFKSTSEGLRYWLVGIQSGVNTFSIGEYKPGRIVIACYFKPLGIALERWIDSPDFIGSRSRASLWSEVTRAS